MLIARQILTGAGKVGSETRTPAIYQLSQRKLQPSPTVKIAGQALDERSLRFGLEKCLRALAHLSDRDERVKLIDMANRARPRTLF